MPATQFIRNIPLVAPILFTGNKEDLHLNSGEVVFLEVDKYDWDTTLIEMIHCEKNELIFSEIHLVKKDKENAYWLGGPIGCGDTPWLFKNFNELMLFLNSLKINTVVLSKTEKRSWSTLFEHYMPNLPQQIFKLDQFISSLDINNQNDQDKLLKIMRLDKTKACLDNELLCQEALMYGKHSHYFYLNENILHLYVRTDKQIIPSQIKIPEELFSELGKILGSEYEKRPHFFTPAPAAQNNHVNGISYNP